jgi:uncharacterized protein YggE
MAEKDTYANLVFAVIMAIAILGGAYMLSTSMPQPVVNIEENPNVYVSSTPPEHTIDVSATVTDYMEPDLLVVGLTVETETEDAKESQEETAVKVAAVEAAIKALGVKDEDIKTSRYSVDVVRESHYICRNKTGETDCYWDYVIKGYKTTHSLVVNIENLDAGGDIVDAAVDAGAEVDYISFTLKPETREETKKELLAEASSEAKSKAESIASGLGVEAGDAFSASESYYYYPVYREYDYMMAAEEAPGGTATEIYGGEIEITATVSASFEIK